MQHWAPHPTCCPGLWWQRQGEEAEASAEPAALGPLQGQGWECKEAAEKLHRRAVTRQAQSIRKSCHPCRAGEQDGAEN